MATFSVEIRRKGNADGILKRILTAITGPKTVKVGYPAGKTDPGIVMQAVWNEFGTQGRTPRRGGWGGPIPERPFVRNAMRNGVEKFKAQARYDARKIVLGELKMTTALENLGLVGKSEIQRSISSNIPPPNADLTLKLKNGKTQTLIDTGEMRQKTTYHVEGKR